MITKEETLKINQEEAKAKRVDGSVLGVIGDNFASHLLYKYNVEFVVLGEKKVMTLGDALSMLVHQLEHKETQVQALKKALENQNERLEIIERKMSNYGLE